MGRVTTYKYIDYIKDQTTVNSLQFLIREKIMTVNRTLICAAALLLLVNTTGCKSNNEQAGAPATQKPVVVQPQDQQAAPPQLAPERVAITGKVTETMNASGYTYVNVETDNGSVWAAMPETTIEVGQDIALAGGMEMQNFESKSLGRTFDSVVFSSGMASSPGSASVPAGTSAVPAATGGDSFSEAIQGEASQATVSPMGSSGGSQAAMAPSEEIAVEKAEGDNAYTVAELFEKRGELDQKQVKVKGKVVKVSMMIMGKNWLHIQDGSGDVASKTHDLVVTTAGQAEKGATVVVEGKLSSDRDFGSGYRYDVIVEDAEVK